MKFEEIKAADGLAMTSYDAQGVDMDDTRYDFPVLLANQPNALPTQSAWQDFSLDDVQAACASGVEVILLGTGEKQQFVAPQLRAQAASLGVGLECMNTAAACRTYMFLRSEGRNVWAWLWI